MTTRDRHQQIVEIFAGACDIDADGRDAFLDNACGDDGDLRREVEKLLARDRGDDGSAMLQDMRAAVARDTMLQESVSALPREIGPYRIRSVIASGGMGIVYLAVQDNPRRQVALKVMRQGLAAKSALRRFEYEAQILARLRHPHIAQIYDAGTHDDGSGATPYFAMEYIPNAKTLTEYVADRNLGTRERLELFARVCDAVHHGHQKGIIHRDLKPGNILVDSEGEPRIIDFGVARATDSDLAVTTLQTDIGQLVGTLQYMSPEQCDADPHDLDIRSDVYALGVIMYEVLTNHVPYDLSTVLMFEAVGVIRDAAPMPLSSFNATLRGDVETIALKALEKDRRRRYRSTSDLADDIRRYLNDEPIEARRAHALYLMGKFVRRHRVAVTLAALVALVVAMAVVSTIAGVNAQASEARADALAANAERDVLQAAHDARREIVLSYVGFQDELLDRIEELPASAAISEFIVERVGNDVERLHLSDPEDTELRRVLAAALQAIAEVQDGSRNPSVGDRATARHNIGHALSITTAMLATSPDDIDTTRLHASLLQTRGDLLHKDGDAIGALADRRAALGLRRQLRTRGSVADARALVAALNNVAHSVGKLEPGAVERAALYQEAFDVADQLARRHPNDVAVLRDLSVGHLRMAFVESDPDSGQRHAREAVRIRTTLLSGRQGNNRERRDLAFAHRMLAQMITDPTSTEAVAHYGHYVDLTLQLGLESPDDQRAASDVAAALDVLLWSADYAPQQVTVQRLRDARRIVQRQLTTDPGKADRLATIATSLASVLRHVDPTTTALATVESSIDAISRHAPGTSSNDVVRLRLMQAELTPDPTEAVRLIDVAIGVLGERDSEEAQTLREDAIAMRQTRAQEINP